MNKKIIFTIGGLFSGIGKGIITSSVGSLLKNNQQKVSIVKLDPYLNVDARFINPTEHGETFVTYDGKETDMDIGHYERFLNEKQSGENCLTSGLIIQEMIAKERSNQFDGRTIDFFDMSKAIEQKLLNYFTKKHTDVLIVEIGGNISDYNIKPFLCTLKNIQQNPEFDTIVLFLSYIPQFKHNNEFKTRATQNAVELLTANGIHLDFLILRSFTALPDKTINKVARLCTLKFKNIFNVINNNIYAVPKLLYDNGLIDTLLTKLRLNNQIDLSFWEKFLSSAKQTALATNKPIHIGLVNKYKNFKESYFALVSTLEFSSYLLKKKFKISEINPQELEKTGDTSSMHKFDGIIIPGGFGLSGTQGKIWAAQFAREHKIPLLGLCYGMQMSVVEYFRNVLNHKNATSREITQHADDLLIVDYVRKDKEMYLGEYKIKYKKGSLLEKCYLDANYDLNKIYERHRHRFGFLDKYVDMVKNDPHFVVSARTDDDISRVVGFELTNLPFFAAVQFHPELNSFLDRPHPIILAFFKAVLKHKNVQ